VYTKRNKKKKCIVLFLTISRVRVCVPCGVVWFVCVHRYGSNRFLFILFFFLSSTHNRLRVQCILDMCARARTPLRQTALVVAYIYILCIYVLTYNTHTQIQYYTYIRILSICYGYSSSCSAQTSHTIYDTSPFLDAYTHVHTHTYTIK